MQNDQTIFKGDLEIGLYDPLRWSPDSSMLAWVATIHSDTEANRYELALTDVRSRKRSF